MKQIFKVTVSEQEILLMADKYHVSNQIDNSFFREMIVGYLVCQKRTGRDPHEWLKAYDQKIYGNNGGIGWIDAIRAIEAIVKKYEILITELNDKT